MMLKLQRYSFNVEYRRGCTLVIADTLSRAPLPDASHYPVHQDLVYRLELEHAAPDLSGFQNATLQDIQAAAATDPEQIELRSIIETGWPADKNSLPDSVRPYWAIRHELTSHDGLLFKQDRVITPTSLRPDMLHKLHAAHRGPEFTQCHARSCLFWPGLTGQINDMCQSCATCAQHAQKHPREPLQPYPVPTLPWQLVSQDLFVLNGYAYLVTVDHYSDFYEIDRLPTIQSSAVIQATKPHFSRHGVPHTLITDNGTQFTSELFQSFTQQYKFNHVTSSPYWSQSNGRAEAAVKSAKHILLTADDVDLALLSVRNTPPAGHTFSPAQRLFGRCLRTNLSQSSETLEPQVPPKNQIIRECAHHKLQQKVANDKRVGQPLAELPPGTRVFAKPPKSSSSKAWIPEKIVGPAGPRSHFIKTDKHQIRRNRTQVRLAPPPRETVMTDRSSLPDMLLPNNLTAFAPVSHSRTLVTPIEPPVAIGDPHSVIPPAPSQAATLQSPPPSPQSQAPDQAVMPTPVRTRSGRTVLLPARFRE